MAQSHLRSPSVEFKYLQDHLKIGTQSQSLAFSFSPLQGEFIMNRITVQFSSNRFPIKNKVCKPISGIPAVKSQSSGNFKFLSFQKFVVLLLNENHHSAENRFHISQIYIELKNLLAPHSDPGITLGPEEYIARKI